MELTAKQGRALSWVVARAWADKPLSGSGFKWPRANSGPVGTTVQCCDRNHQHIPPTRWYILLPRRGQSYLRNSPTSAQSERIFCRPTTRRIKFIRIVLGVQFVVTAW